MRELAAPGPCVPRRRLPVDSLLFQLFLPPPILFLLPLHPQPLHTTTTHSRSATDICTVYLLDKMSSSELSELSSPLSSPPLSDQEDPFVTTTASKEAVGIARYFTKKKAPAKPVAKAPSKPAAKAAAKSAPKTKAKAPKPKPVPRSPSPPKRAPSPPHDYVLADNPDIAVSVFYKMPKNSIECVGFAKVGGWAASDDDARLQFIVAFASRFHSVLPKSVPTFGPQELERSIVESVPGDLVEILLCALLSLLLNRKKPVE